MNGIPADDTIARIISTIEPEQFHQCFVKGCEAQWNENVR
ncbi:mobile element protein [Vibrio ponticus]|nr:mobile element protein [Vibrio ponticus]